MSFRPYRVITHREVSCDLALMDPADAGVCQAVSRLLTEASANLAESNGGHVPDVVVRDIIHVRYTSVGAVSAAFSSMADRILAIDPLNGMLLGAILVARSSSVILAYNSQQLLAPSDVIPGLPAGHHSIFNLAVAKPARSGGIGRMLVDAARDHAVEAFGGRGVWLRSEPPEHDVYVRMGLRHHSSADQYFSDAVSLPPWAANARQFNSRFECRCPDVAAVDGERKLKYRVFTGTRRD